MKERNSNIELLRILSIFMIILSHYTVHNTVSNYLLPLGFNRLLLEITTLGNIGVIIFILITGYFSINQEKSFKFKKLFFLWMQTFTYSFLIYIIFVLLKLEPFSIKLLIKSILPITFNGYWFISVYVIIYIFSPFINKFINSLNKKEHLNFIIISLFIFSILNMLTNQKYYCNELIQFIIFYSIGAYIKKYNQKYISKYNKYIFICTSIILVLSAVIFDVIGTKIEIFSTHSTYFFSRTSIMSIIFAVTLFNMFIHRKSFSSKFLNIFSSLVLGVYLISDNEYVRKILWTDILKVSNYVNSHALILHMIGSLIFVFIVCIIIEFIRKNTIERITEKITSSVENKILKSKVYCKYKNFKL